MATKMMFFNYTYVCQYMNSKQIQFLLESTVCMGQVFGAMVKMLLGAHASYIGPVAGSASVLRFLLLGSWGSSR